MKFEYNTILRNSILKIMKFKILNKYFLVLWIQIKNLIKIRANFSWNLLNINT